LGKQSRFGEKENWIYGIGEKLGKCQDFPNLKSQEKRPSLPPNPHLQNRKERITVLSTEKP